MTGARDAEFHDKRRVAVGEIPRAEFISLEERHYVGAHLAQVDPVLPAVLQRCAGMADLYPRYRTTLLAITAQRRKIFGT